MINATSTVSTHNQFPILYLYIRWRFFLRLTNIYLVIVCLGKDDMDKDKESSDEMTDERRLSSETMEPSWHRHGNGKSETTQEREGTKAPRR